MPKKQFHISLVNKKVYDITERKNFCSNNCFKASNFIKEQMLTSPLWMRNQENVPEFKLMIEVNTLLNNNISKDVNDQSLVNSKSIENSYKTDSVDDSNFSNNSLNFSKLTISDE